MIAPASPLETVFENRAAFIRNRNIIENKITIFFECAEELITSYRRGV